MNKTNKKYTLAIETTGRVCGVALLCNDKILYENNIESGLTHSVTLFDNIFNAFKKSHIKASDLSKICVSAGPGSFTGIRIGIASAIGIAKPHNIKVSYIDTLDALSYNAKKLADVVIPMIDARANRVFMSVYDGHTLHKYINDSIYDIDDIITYLNKYFTDKRKTIAFVGDGAIKYKEKFKKLGLLYMYAKDNDMMQKASSLSFVNGIVSKKVNINYILKSKAEREKNG